MWHLKQFGKVPGKTGRELGLMTNINWGPHHYVPTHIQLNSSNHEKSLEKLRNIESFADHQQLTILKLLKSNWFEVGYLLPTL